MKKKLSIILAVLFAFLLAACSSGKTLPNRRLGAEEAFNSAKGEAVKFAPEQAKAVEDA